MTLESERDELEGHARVAWPAHPVPPDLPGTPWIPDMCRERRMATVALAGPVAELVFRGEDVLAEPEAVATWRGDWLEAEAQIARMHATPDARERERDAILAELRDMFDDPVGYERLARIADALDAHGTLDGRLFLEAVVDR